MKRIWPEKGQFLLSDEVWLQENKLHHWETPDAAVTDELQTRADYVNTFTHNIHRTGGAIKSGVRCQQTSHQLTHLHWQMREEWTAGGGECSYLWGWGNALRTLRRCWCNISGSLLLQCDERCILYVSKGNQNAAKLARSLGSTVIYVEVTQNQEAMWKHVHFNGLKWLICYDLWPLSANIWKKLKYIKKRETFNKTVNIALFVFSGLPELCCLLHLKNQRKVNKINLLRSGRSSPTDWVRSSSRS